jgi:thioredoxin reductase
MNQKIWDVIIVGAGPAGLSAALILGRACRQVMLCDSGTPRSWAAKKMHGFVTREGISPDAFRRVAHRELSALDSVTFVQGEATRAVRRSDGSFECTIGTTRQVVGRKLLIATGLFDDLPRIDGIEKFFGKSVFQCPYCDGWEIRNSRVAVYGRGQRGFEMARAMTAWSRDLVLCTDGHSRLSRPSRLALARNGIEVIETRISRLTGTRGKLSAIEFTDGRELPRDVLFFDTTASGQSRLAESLGCQFTSKKGVRCGQYEATSVPGVFVAGNIIRDVQLSIVAAAEGARAAFGINRALTREDFERNATGRRHIEHPQIQSEVLQR